MDGIGLYKKSLHVIIRLNIDEFKDPPYVIEQNLKRIMLRKKILANLIMAKCLQSIKMRKEAIQYKYKPVGFKF